MGVSRGKGWTDADIDKDDPEAYHGGGIVTAEIKERNLAKERLKKQKKRIKDQAAMLAGLKANRSNMSETL